MNLKSKLPPKFQKYASLGIIPKILLLPFAISTIATFYIIRPFFLIQVHKVKDWRIGHLAANTELTRLQTIARNVNSRRKLITIYYFGSRSPSNGFLSKFWQRELPSVHGHWGWLLNEISARVDGMNSSDESTIWDPKGLFQMRRLPNFFTKKEELLGQQFLKLNLDNEKFICLNVRDHEYMARRSSRDRSYHDYRDSDIKTYVVAAEALAELGYTVFRMGAIVKEPLVSKHPRVIDYATNGMRTEFLDVYLGARCTFTISTGSGWDSVPMIFRRPMIWVNHLPIFENAVHLLMINYPKILEDKESGILLSLTELIERNVARTSDTQGYKDFGVIIRDLSSEELVEAVTEMVARVEGTFVETPEQKEMQAKLKHILSTHPKLQPSPNFYPIRAQFASCFLSRYPNFLD